VVMWCKKSRNQVYATRLVRHSSCLLYYMTACSTMPATRRATCAYPAGFALARNSLQHTTHIRLTVRGSAWIGFRTRTDPAYHASQTLWALDLDDHALAHGLDCVLHADGHAYGYDHVDAHAHVQH